MDDATLQTDERRPVLNDIPIEVLVSVGHAHPTVKELLALESDTVFPLDRQVNDPVELFVGERLIARGHLEVVEDESGDQLAVRITDVAASPSAFAG